ncbi:outer membrane protein assembly factor BamA [Bermanella marisrubri]|uniref:Outer membrane protein assembly factor BamA n=1 Tax=Bermanella marisrubri TaxID=207949 RepID=Q1N1W6_9GAMM|nr:outer membrane protein assembly factor BamA [Bermanella marisrubri]EAT12165.1 probable outer membrane protein [Oceanobacter sp. RED65] [Bermanella marisrubri]QIZ83641.1 outer membrane protein assembly factor BamA [Bermanella marisrubri]
MKYTLISLVFAFISTLASAKSFVVEDIRVDGLQRVSAGSVFSAFPVNIGDKVDTATLAGASRSLFKTGYFNDVKLQRDGNILIVNVIELPTITQLEIEGNSAIETEQLKEGLKQAGLAEGYVFKRATLERLELELERQYVSQGRYDANIETEVEKLPRNRVALTIKIDEGSVASISHINIVGHKAFTKQELLDQFELKTTNMWSWYKSDDKYAREKLSGDLERLRSFYLDRGYIRFNVESTQVSLSPNKEDVFITVNIHEGDIYKVNDVSLAGELIVEEEQLEKLIVLDTEDTFSRRKVTFTQDLISRRLGNEGFTFASVNGVPKINDEEKTVDITFFVEPGKRTYVRRINFAGNESTMDEVLRREMLQMEGGWASTELIEQGKTRLEQLGFFKTVSVETPKVPGSDELVDVNYNVEEQPSGSLNLSIGYSSADGVIIGSSVSQNNFMGTGNKMSTSVNKTDAVTSLNLSFSNPYYTVDGISRGFSVFYRETDFSQLSLSDYNTDTYGGRMSFGFPINSRERLSFSVEASKTEMEYSQFAPLEISEFVDAQGENFTELTLGSQWVWTTLNRGLFPTAGARQTLSLEATVPGSELEYYRATYKAEKYFPLSSNGNWTFRLRSELGYGDGYGDTDELPFFQNFRAGGVGSVRGFSTNSLGPKGVISNGVDSNTGDPIYIEDSNSIGGNLLTEASAELVFPMPFIEDQRSMRSVLFVDAGNVFDTQCLVLPDGEEHPGCIEGFDADEMRVGAGVSLTWVTAIGPLTFTFARDLNSKAGDETEGFEFSLGQVF